MREKWLKAFWRWFLAALDRKDWKEAMLLADCIEKVRRQP